MIADEVDNMKTWRPDTCGCYIEEIYIVLPSGKTDIKGGGKVLTKCVAHATVPDDELYGVLRSENGMKNRVYRALCGLDGIGIDLSKSILNGEPTTTELKDGVQYFWTFSGSGKGRTLAVSVSGATLTSTQKIALKNFIEAQFSAGKLSIA